MEQSKRRRGGDGSTCSEIVLREGGEVKEITDEMREVERVNKNNKTKGGNSEEPEYGSLQEGEKNTFLLST